MESLNLNEASKLNPGKNAIKASLLGSKSASALVKTAQTALKQWPALDRAKKKDVYAKLAELKKAAKQNMGAELKGVKPEKKAAASEKAAQMYSSFLAAVKKREKAADSGEEKPEDSEEEKPKDSEEETEKEDNKVDVSALEKKRDEIKDWFVDMQEKMGKIEAEAEKSGDWDKAEKIAKSMEKEAVAKANEYNDIVAKIEDANKSNEAYRALTEWFQFLLEFDAEKAVDQIKDKAEDIEKKAKSSDGEDSKDSEDEEDGEGDDSELDALLDELDSLEEKEFDLESELDGLNDDRLEAIESYNDAAKKHKEAKSSGADEDTLYDLDDAEYEAKEAKDQAILDYNSAKSGIGKKKEELSKKIKEVKDKIQKAKAGKNESRVIMTFDNFINERYNS
jgi:hypothetical protein